MDRCGAKLSVLYVGKIEHHPKWKSDGTAIAINTGWALEGKLSSTEDFTDKKIEELKLLSDQSWEALQFDGSIATCDLKNNKRMVIIKNIKLLHTANLSDYVGNIPKNGRNLEYGKKTIHLNENGKVEIGNKDGPEKFQMNDHENCHSPVLSPDKTLVLYICELTGLMFSRF
jgi:hypothetical protein